MPRFRPAARSTFICSAAAAVAVGAGWQAWQHGRVRELPFADVTLGPVRFPTPTVHTYRTLRPLRRYVLSADPGHVPSAPALAKLDFGRYSLILVVLGPRSSTGYSIRVGSVEEQRNRIVVHASQRAPRLGTKVQAAVTYPYRLLRVPATRKPAVVIWEDA